MSSQARLAVLLLMSAIGSALQAATPVRTATHVRPAAGTGQTAANDRQVEAAIRARFAESKINVNHFTVHVQGGVATIEGHADVIQHKGTATRLARAAGAREVVNRIEISEAARERAEANLAKGRRRVQVKRSEKRSERPSQ
jgi:osmotically-inducible protein OsmY